MSPSEMLSANAERRLRDDRRFADRRVASLSKAHSPPGLPGGIAIRAGVFVDAPSQLQRRCRVLRGVRTDLSARPRQRRLRRRDMVTIVRHAARAAFHAAVASCLVALAASRGAAQAAPVVSGTQRLAWDQSVSDPSDIDTLQYALYVDGTRLQVLAASCDVSTSASTAPCAARLPTLPVGPHVLQLTAFRADQTDVESAPSAPLAVNVIPSTGPLPPQLPIQTQDGVALRVNRLVQTDDAVNGLAVASDGSLLIAERGGAIAVRRQQIVTHDAAALTDVVVDGGGLLAIAPDSDFSRTHFVYVAYTTQSRDGSMVARLARLREASGTFGDRIVLFERPLTKTVRSAALRVGSDGTLYFGIEDRLVRLNPDGTTPVDQPGLTPTIATDYTALSGLDWQPISGALWTVDDLTSGSGRLARVARNSTAKSPAATIGIPTTASSLAFYNREAIAAFRGNAFIASDDAQTLLRVRFDTKDLTTVRAIERLLSAQIGGIRTITVGPDGWLYLGTAQGVIQLATQ